MRLAALVFVCVFASVVAAQAPFLVRDINTQTSAFLVSDPGQFFQFGGVCLFSAEDPVHGRELWVSDGTTAGTSLLKDINVGSQGSDPSGFVNVNGVVFFSADDGVHGRELWRTDGTASGTVLVTDLHAGPASSNPAALTALGVLLYFVAENGSTYVFTSDGTSAGTQLLDYAQGADVLAVAGGQVFKFDNSGELRLLGASQYSSVLLASGLTLFGPPVAAGGVLYFVADDGTHGFELWKSDGTVGGTAMVIDIRSSGDGVLTDLFSMAGTVFFGADDGTHGFELWSSDGTAAGTSMVLDINTGAGDSILLSPLYGPLWAEVGGELLFVASDGSDGFELWKSDGTSGGTSLVKDIRPGAEDAFGISSWFIASSGMLYFTANDGTHGDELWSSDGTNAGTAMVADLTAGAGTSWFAAVGALAGGVMLAHEGELWFSDGSVAGTALVNDIYANALGSSPHRLCDVNGTLFFVADDGVHGAELWKSDGTASGTVMVIDLYSGQFGSHPSDLVSFNGSIYFTAQDAVDFGLYVSDGSASGTTRVWTGGVSFLTVCSGLLFFRGVESVNGVGLWVSDGTVAGTTFLTNVDVVQAGLSPPMIDVSGTLYFSGQTATHGVELWKSDGTAAGTVMVADLAAGAASSNPTMLTAVNGLVFFDTSMALYVSDGTVAGTIQLTVMSVSSLAAVGSELFFIANGHSLYKSDGTASGTVSVYGTFSGTTAAGFVASASGGAYLVTEQVGSGHELFFSDGTTAGTQLVSDIRSGTYAGAASTLGHGSNPRNLIVVNDVVYFVANDGTHGFEIWRSDGTAAGTLLVGEVVTGSGDGNLSNFVVSGGWLFFTADDGVNGRELWSFNLPSTPPQVSLSTVPVAYTENDPALPIDAAAAITDADSATFDGGSMSISFSANGAPEDSLVVATTADVRRVGSDIEFDTTGAFAGLEVIIGTVPASGPGSGLAGEPLVVSFNAACTPGAAQALLRAVSYFNSSDSPSALTRALVVTVDDGSGGVSTAALPSIEVTPVNDSPVLTLPGTVNTPAGTPISFLGTISLADADAGNADVELQIAAVSGVITLAPASGVTITAGAQGSSSVTILGTLAQVNAALNGLTFTPDAGFSGAATLGFAADDLGNTGGAAETATGSVTITVSSSPSGGDGGKSSSDGGCSSSSRSSWGMLVALASVVALTLRRRRSGLTK